MADASVLGAGVRKDVGVRLSPRPLFKRATKKVAITRCVPFARGMRLGLSLGVTNPPAFAVNSTVACFLRQIGVSLLSSAPNSFDTRRTRGTIIKDIPAPRRPSRDASAWLVLICRPTKTATNPTVLPLALDPSPGQFPPPGEGDALTANRWHHHDRLTRTGDLGGSCARSLRSYRRPQEPPVPDDLALDFSAAASGPADSGIEGFHRCSNAAIGPWPPDGRGRPEGARPSSCKATASTGS